MKTTICIGSHELAGQRFTHGEEIPSSVLDGELRDWWLDHKWAVEYDSTERRSLYRLLHRFSGSSETERLSNQELAACALT